MSEIIVITNRKLCKEDFLLRLEKVAKARPFAIILREKDLPEGEYSSLAKSAVEICNKYGTRCIPHYFAGVAAELGAVHLPMAALRGLSSVERRRFAILGASCHSAEEAVEAEGLGCTYITFGHVFETDCKAGLPGRGVAQLEEVCGSVSIPVYAIGGIDKSNIAEVIRAGAGGACVMSGAMTCKNVQEYIDGLKGAAGEV